MIREDSTYLLQGSEIIPHNKFKELTSHVNNKYKSLDTSYQLFIKISNAEGD